MAVNFRMTPEQLSDLAHYVRHKLADAADLCIEAADHINQMDATATDTKSVVAAMNKAAKAVAEAHGNWVKLALYIKNTPTKDS